MPPFNEFGAAGGGAGGVVDFAPISVAPTLVDSGDRVDRPGTGFNTGTGLASFYWVGANSNAIVAGHTTQGTPRFSWLLEDLLPGFNPADHMLFVRMRSIDITNNPRRMGLAVFISDAQDHAGSGGGGVAIQDYSGTGSDDRPGESSSTSTTQGTAPAEALVQGVSLWRFGADGDVSVEQLVNGATKTELRNRGTRRDINFPGGRPAASALYLQVASIKSLSGLLNDDDLAEAIIELGYSPIPT